MKTHRLGYFSTLITIDPQVTLFYIAFTKTNFIISLPKAEVSAQRFKEGHKKKKIPMP